MLTADRVSLNAAFIRRLKRMSASDFLAAGDAAHFALFVQQSMAEACRSLDVIRLRVTGLPAEFTGSDITLSDDTKRRISEGRARLLANQTPDDFPWETAMIQNIKNNG